MPATAKAALFFGPGQPFEIREVPIPEVEPEGVLIRVTHANVCGSDLHVWRGDAPLRLPDDGWIFGHEMTGRVAKLGSKIKTDSLGRPLQEGDRVAYTYFYPCGRCYACLNKEPAACPNKIERPLGPGTFPHLHGAFADHYYLRPGGAIFKVPAVNPDSITRIAVGAASRCTAETRYSPARCTGARTQKVTGNPDSDHISTTYAERANLTMRMSMRRFTRLTNGFSKKVDNHKAALALHFMHYNFARKERAVK